MKRNILNDYLTDIGKITCLGC